MTSPAKPKPVHRWPEPAAVVRSAQREGDEQLAAAVAKSPVLNGLPPAEKRRGAPASPAVDQSPLQIARLSGVPGAGTELAALPRTSTAHSSRTPPPESRENNTSRTSPSKRNPIGAVQHQSIADVREFLSRDDLATPHHERDQASILLLGHDDALAAHLTDHLRHHVVTMTADGLSALPRANFDLLVADAELWESVKESPAVAVLRRLSRDISVLTFAANEGPATKLKCHDGPVANVRHTLLQELVRNQIQNFFWTNAFAAVTVSGTMADNRARDAEVQTLKVAVRQAESESQAMAQMLSKVTADKVSCEGTCSFLTAENARLRTKLTAARAAAAQALAAPQPKVIMVNAYQDTEVLKATLQTCPTPKDVAASMFTWLLSDQSYALVHDILKDAIEQLTGFDTDPNDIEELIRVSGIDAATQQWILYEYSQRHGKSSGPRRALHTPVEEKPIKLVPVADPSVIDSWGFHAFDFSTEQLVALYVLMLDKLDLIKLASVPRNNMIRFVRAVAKMYKDVPYHSFTHAVDVSQIAYKLVNTSARQYLTDLDVFSLMIAALCHDVDHPGTTGQFQINDGTRLAMIYNDQSPLENHHASCAFLIAAEPPCDIFCGMADATYASVRKTIIKAILVTDMNHHFELAGTLKNMNQESFFQQKTAESRQMMVNLLLHTADLSNVCRPWTVSKAWSDRVLQEFFQQGDMEAKKGLPISANMDRKTTRQDQLSLGFIDFIVSPLIMPLATLIPGVSPLIDNINANRAIWEAMHVASSTQTPSTKLSARTAPRPPSADSSGRRPDSALPAASDQPSTGTPSAGGRLRNSTGSAPPVPAQVVSHPVRSSSEAATPTDAADSDSLDAPRRGMQRVRSRSAPTSPVLTRKAVTDRAAAEAAKRPPSASDYRNMRRASISDTTAESIAQLHRVWDAAGDDPLGSGARGLPTRALADMADAFSKTILKPLGSGLGAGFRPSDGRDWMGGEQQSRLDSHIGPESKPARRAPRFTSVADPPKEDVRQEFFVKRNSAPPVAGAALPSIAKPV